MMATSNPIHVSDLVGQARRLCTAYDVRRIVETGTYDGLGSTSQLAQLGIPLVTIECDPDRAAVAKQNLSQFPHVQVWHGYSLGLHAMLAHVKQAEYLKDVSADVQVDGGSDPVGFYTDELGNRKCDSDLLRKALVSDPCFVFLDSCGGVGLLEVEELLRCWDHHGRPVWILALDDIKHVKHFKSVQLLQSLGHVFHEVGRWGWCVLRKQIVGQQIPAAITDYVKDIHHEDPT